MALFTLKLNDNVATPVDFLGSTYHVDDGGFDIGTPQRVRELAVLRPGFYVPVTDYAMFREAKIKFSIEGATRSAVLSALNAIELTLRRLAARSRVGAGARVELIYAWEGATDLTYFEVYAGELAFPEDVLSVAKVHRKIGGNYILPECELTLILSAGGYGVSIFGGPSNIQLYRDDPGSKSSTGLTVQNPGVGQYNYVTIDGVDVGGSLPMITKIILESGSPYSNWKQVYIGHQVAPFPTTMLFDDSDLDQAIGSPQNDSSANGGTYRSASWNTGGPFYGYFADFGWNVSNATVGNFYAVLHLFKSGTVPIPSPFNLNLAVGVDDYTHWGVRYVNDWVGMNSGDPVTSLPLGQIQLPPNDPTLSGVGTLDDTLMMGLFVSGDTGVGTLNFDYMYLLPMGSGLRSWRARLAYVTGTLVDDDWLGLAYLKDGSNKISTPFFGLMEPIKLEPGLTQRLYFYSIGYSNSQDERQRQFTVKVLGTPAYAALAM